MTDAATAPVKTGCKCSRCAKVPKKEVTRLPKGWSRVGKETLCVECFKAAYVVRAVTLPVLGPQEKADWPALREMMRTAWAETARYCNHLITEMYARDVRRQPGDAKLPPWKRPYLYQKQDARYNLPGQTRAGLENAVAGKYSSMRYELLWLGSASLPTFKYGVPYDAPEQSWKPILVEEDSKRILKVSIMLPGGRTEFLLRSSSEFRRQVDQFRWLAENPDLRGSISIYEKRVNSHTSHGNGTGSFPRKRIMCKMVGYFPVKERPDISAKTIVVTTDKDSFLFAACEGDDKPWVVNGDGFRDQCFQHLRNLQRVRDDLKPEFRKSGRKRRPFDKGRLKKFHDRQKTFMQQTIAAIVGFSLRRRCTEVVYDDSVKDYLPSFPYHEFRLMLEQKCRAEGLAYRWRNAEKEKKPAEPPPSGDEES